MSEKIEIVIEAQNEDISPEEALSLEACGVDHSDCINHINERLSQGDLWAWCCVKVSANLKGVEIGNDFLGCSTYDNEEHFKKDSGYFESMKSNALREAKEFLEDLKGVLTC